MKATSFLLDDWLPGTVVLSNRKVFKNIKLKFDVTKNEFVFNRNDTAFILGTDAVEMGLYQETGDSLIFKNGYLFNNTISHQNFCRY